MYIVFILVFFVTSWYCYQLGKINGFSKGFNQCHNEMDHAWFRGYDRGYDRGYEIGFAIKKDEDILDEKHE